MGKNNKANRARKKRVEQVNAAKRAAKLREKYGEQNRINAELDWDVIRNHPEAFDESLAETYVDESATEHSAKYRNRHASVVNAAALPASMRAGDVKEYSDLLNQILADVPGDTHALVIRFADGDEDVRKTGVNDLGDGVFHIERADVHDYIARMVVHNQAFLLQLWTQVAGGDDELRTWICQGRMWHGQGVDSMPTDLDGVTIRDARDMVVV